MYTENPRARQHDKIARGKPLRHLARNSAIVPTETSARRCTGGTERPRAASSAGQPGQRARAASGGIDVSDGLLQAQRFQMAATDSMLCLSRGVQGNTVHPASKSNTSAASRAGPSSLTLQLGTDTLLGAAATHNIHWQAFMSACKTRQPAERWIIDHV